MVKALIIEESASQGQVVRNGEMLGGGDNLFAEDVCGMRSSREQIVDSAQSLIRCGYGHPSPIPQIKGRFQGSSVSWCSSVCQATKESRVASWPEPLSTDPYTAEARAQRLPTTQTFSG